MTRRDKKKKVFKEKWKIWKSKQQFPPTNKTRACLSTNVKNKNTWPLHEENPERKTIYSAKYFDLLTKKKEIVELWPFTFILWQEWSHSLGMRSKFVHNQAIQYHKTENKNRDSLWQWLNKRHVLSMQNTVTLSLIVG
jgi:hypothetical protein